MKSIEDQLTDALAKVESLEADASANTDLLNEVQGKLTAAEGLVDSLKGELEKSATASADMESNFKAEIEAARAETENVKAENSKANETIAALEAAAKTAEQIAAERYGAGNAPVAVTAGEVVAGNSSAELLAKFNAISDPTEQTAFWRGLSTTDKAALLNASKIDA